MPKKKLTNECKTLPLLQKLQWTTNPTEFLETCAKRYGDIFTVKIGPSFSPVVIISNPQALEEIFNTYAKQLESGEAAGIKLPTVGQQSLLALSGEKHQRQRKLLTPPFHGERMRAYGQLIDEITKQVIEQQKVNQPFTMHLSMQEISFQVILKAVFGLKDSPRYQKLKALLIERLNPKQPLLAAMMLLFPVLQKDLGPWSPWGKAVRNLQQIDELIYAEIADRHANLDPDRTDILSLMMAARDEQGQPMTDLELRDELMTLLFAGYETTATSLAWAFYWIHKLPEVREKLLQELDSIGNDVNAMGRSPFLNAVCSETLRLYAPTILTLNRVVQSPIKINGEEFEPGTILAGCIYLTHQREDLYPQPKQFKPERFLERQFTPYEFIPFGGGNRRCIGMAFAQFEMKIVLATILSRWELALVDTTPVKPVRRGFLLGPSDNLEMVVKGLRHQNQPLLQTTSN